MAQDIGELAHRGYEAARTGDLDIVHYPSPEEAIAAVGR
jgi:hypothetical protein